MLHLRNRKVQQYNVVRKKTGSNDCQEKILCSGDTTGSNGIVKGKKNYGGRRTCGAPPKAVLTFDSLPQH
jgi:hypothetical protein